MLYNSWRLPSMLWLSHFKNYHYTNRHSNKLSPPKIGMIVTKDLWVPSTKRLQYKTVNHRLYAWSRAVVTCWACRSRTSLSCLCSSATLSPSSAAALLMMVCSSATPPVSALCSAARGHHHHTGHQGWRLLTCDLPGGALERADILVCLQLEKRFLK